MANEETFAVGDRVQIVTNTPENRPVFGTVKVVNDPEEEPGKQIGVELDDYTVFAHSLDGVVDEREQGADQPVVGKGWWARPGNLVKVEE